MTPANGATSVGVGTTVSINFSEQVNCATVTSATFRLTSSAGPVTATVACGGASATLIPATALATSTTYTITLTTGVTDVAGNAIANQFTSSFTTASAAGGTSYTVGGSLAGLGAGKSVVLQMNSANNLALSANGTFVFGTTVTTGSAYNVTVLTQPAGQVCTVANGSGIMGSANVTSVAVNCDATYTVGGSVTGLAAGQSVVLQNNGADTLTVSTSGAFTFAITLANGSGYSVTVQTQPSGQICNVANGVGTVSGANVTSVTVSCAASVPSAPTGLTATGGNGTVTLNWNASAGATGYNVYRATTSGFTPGATNRITTSPVSASNVGDTGLTNGTTYYYVVKAVNANGESAASAEASATPSASGAANTWSPRASLPSARVHAAVGVANGVLYVASGGGTGETDLQAYDPVSNTWTTRAGHPDRSYQGAGLVEINGKLYVAGGWNLFGFPVDTLYIYDPAANSWATGASLPRLSACGASGAIDGKLYVLSPCGSPGGPFLDVYDPATNAWTPRASSAHVHSFAASGVINGKFYVAGGLNGPANQVGPGSVAGFTEVYDPVTNGWTTLAPMPTPVSAAASAVYNGKLYVIGGANAANAAVSTVQVYDPASNTWSMTSAAALPGVLSGARAATINGIVYAAGGSATGAPGNGLLAFVPPANAGANSWAAKANLPTARSGTTATEINGRIYVAGGYGGTTSGVPLSVLEVYDPVANAWATRAPMSIPRGNLASETVNGRLYVMGGDNWACNPYTANEEYNPSTNTWTSRAPMPTARTSFGTAVVDGIVYTIGGTAYCGTDYSVVEAYNPVTNSWTTKTPLPRNARNIGAGVVNGIIYVVIGGGNAGVLPNVLAFDPRANAGAGAWTSRSAIPNSGSYGGAPPAVFTINGIIYLAGGDSTGLVQAYDPLRDSWSTKASLPIATYWQAGGAAANGIGYAIGGYRSSPAGNSQANQAYTP